MRRLSLTRFTRRLSGMVFAALVFPRATLLTGFCGTLYVAPESPNPAPPYGSWGTAAHDIQLAIDAAAAGDIVLVTNGLYATGGRVGANNATTNRVVVDKPITLQSVNGPGVTIIEGYQIPGTTNGPAAIRCVFLTANSVLSGFTLRKGATADVGGGALCSSSAILTNCLIMFNSGGGVYGGTLLNCTISANTSDGRYDFGGGGASHSTLTNCLVTGNSAADGGGAADCALERCCLSNNAASMFGGGAYYGTLNGCVLVGNSAGYEGGGILVCFATNCIVYGNMAPTGANYAADEGNGYYCRLNECCTTPMPVDQLYASSGGGFGNITNAPLFLDAANGDFRLQPGSPCINSGLNELAAGQTDLDGHPRISGGTVDIGAYEFQNPASIIAYAWLQLYGMPTDGSADFQDPDLDGMNNWQEWISGTNPTNSASRLSLLAPRLNASGVTVSWLSVTNHAYTLERSINSNGISGFLPLAVNIPGGVTNTAFTDANTAPQTFYRVSTHR
ncbi:MAG TPA: choice-of-anchor Q domain-containing protein [Verrucomicrobiae bacterium]|nr:choice-of-anchor Q domain-containing protein [Verrucomicrobiae bacterium]